MYELTTIQKGMFWLWLAVSGNFISETLGCKTQKFLNENMLQNKLLHLQFYILSQDLSMFLIRILLII